jgi:uncharacterized repeat protein (TIGR01451 family)
VDIRSSVPGGDYLIFSGTSMAGPHVVGVAGLLLSAHKSLRGQVATVESILEGTAIPHTTTETCGGIPGTQIPNNTHGFGRVDALRAVHAADLQLAAPPWPLVVRAGAAFTHTLTVTNRGPAAAAVATLTQTLPAGLGPVSATPSQGQCSVSGEVLTCELGPLAASGSVRVTLRATPTGVGTLASRATAGGEYDYDPANNAADLQATVKP